MCELPPALIHIHAILCFVVTSTQVSSSAPLRGSGLMRKTVQLVSGYNLMLQVPVVDYDSVMTVNGNSGINVVRLALVTASALILPAFICGIAVGTELNKN